MADVMTSEQRHNCMSRIKGKDTKPEMIVRRHIHAAGYRYGLHNTKLPGKPDIVLRRLKTVIFIHGCFWHGHENCKYYRIPQTNTDFWQNKIRTNIDRDRRNIAELQQLGWRVIIVWECDLKPMEKRRQTLDNLLKELSFIANGIHRFPSYPIADPDDAAEAAEPMEIYGPENNKGNNKENNKGNNM